MLQAVGIRRILIGEDVNSLSRAVPQNPVGFPKGFVAQGLQMPGIRPFYKGVILPPGIKQRLYIGKGAQQHQCAPHADSWPRSQPDPMCQHIHPARFCVYSRQPGLPVCICHMTMAAATAALRDSQRGFMGMIHSASPCSRNSLLTPWPSLPMTTAYWQMASWRISLALGDKAVTARGIP